MILVKHDTCTCVRVLSPVCSLLLHYVPWATPSPCFAVFFSDKHPVAPSSRTLDSSLFFTHPLSHTHSLSLPFLSSLPFHLMSDHVPYHLRDLSLSRSHSHTLFRLPVSVLLSVFSPHFLRPSPPLSRRAYCCLLLFIISLTLVVLILSSYSRVSTKLPSLRTLYLYCFCLAFFQVLLSHTLYLLCIPPSCSFRA